MKTNGHDVMHRITIRWYHSIALSARNASVHRQKHGQTQLERTGKATYYRETTNHQQQKTRSTNQQL